jgi:hypothetical protein
MRLPGYLIAFVLVLLLAATTPVGTGAGVHQFDMLHPLFSHVHVVKGRVVSHEQMAFEALGATPPAQGVAVGAGGGGAGTDDLGGGVSPMLPLHSMPHVGVMHAWWDPVDVNPPTGRMVPPPDPPPL